jgi:two-component system cell cycle response regulator
MDGLAAISILKANDAVKKIPIVALTSYAMKEDRQKFFGAGFDGYLAKPIDTRSFLETVKTFLSPDLSRCAQVQADTREIQRWKILMVDDDPKSLRLYEAILGDKSYDLIKAITGREALELAAAHLPDLILLDIILPDIDGLEVTRRIKKDAATKNIPIILITSLDGSETQAAGTESGAEELLNKPVRPLELSARVKSMIRLRQYRDQVAVRQLPFRAQERGKQSGELPGQSPDTRPVVLLVEDNEIDIQLILEALKDQPCRIEVHRTGKDVLTRVQKRDIDLILLDILLLDMDGFEICRRLKASDAARDIQVVIISCLTDLESKIKGIELGAEEFLVKPIIPRELITRVRVLLEKKNHIDKLRSQLETAIDSAKIDWLTGLTNHGSFRMLLGHEIKRASRQGYPVSLILIDIDDFKLYNETLGHATGDAFLRELAQLITSQIRDVDLSARYGGEEFAVLLPYADISVAKKVAKRIRDAITTHAFAASPSESFRHLTASLGMAAFPLDAWKTEDLIEQADQMLYRAKQNGKDQVCVKTEEGLVEVLR